MKELIPMDEYGVFCDAQDTARANSLMVAKVFGKRHADVLRDIEKITAPKSGLSKEFGERNFALSSYKSEPPFPHILPLEIYVAIVKEMAVKYGVTLESA